MNSKSWKDYIHYCIRQKRQPCGTVSYLAEYHFPTGYRLVTRCKSSCDFDTIVWHTQNHLLTECVGDVHITFVSTMSQQPSTSFTVFVNDLADTIQDLLSLFGYTGGYSPIRLAKAMLNQSDPVCVHVANMIDFNQVDTRDMLTLLLVLYNSGVETTLVFDDMLYEDPFDDK